MRFGSAGIVSGWRARRPVGHPITANGVRNPASAMDTNYPRCDKLEAMVIWPFGDQVFHLVAALFVRWKIAGAENSSPEFLNDLLHQFTNLYPPAAENEQSSARTRDRGG
jgi:hypothetical protein